MTVCQAVSQHILLRPKYYFHKKVLLICLELIKGVIHLAEGYDTAGTETMALFRADGNSVPVKGNYAVKAVFHLQHEARLS